jgi:hypothetical protein
MNGVIGEGEGSIRWHAFTQTWPGGVSVSLPEARTCVSRAYGPWRRTPRPRWMCACVRTWSVGGGPL